MIIIVKGTMTMITTVLSENRIRPLIQYVNHSNTVSS